MNEPPRTASARRLLYGAGLNLETTQGETASGATPRPRRFAAGIHGSRCVCPFEHDPKAREMRLDTIEDAYIEGTKRNFVEKGVYGDSYREDEKPILVVSMKAAWNVDETPYIEMSKKYNVDFRVYGYEMGLEFNREIEIVEGRLVTNRRIKFKDYKWECPDPTLGG